MSLGTTRPSSRKTLGVGGLQDTEASWPAWLKRELDGFEYETLGGSTVESENTAHLRGAAWVQGMARWRRVVLAPAVSVSERNSPQGRSDHDCERHLV